MEPQISALSPATADDDAVISALTVLINEVYATAEHGLWADGATRTTDDEVAGFVRSGQIAMARLDGRLAGCIRIYRLGDRTSGFGMLAADPRHRGVGIGRELVRYAEDWGRYGGHSTMQLEVLTPRGWTHPSKEFLVGWYSRIGYRMVSTDPVEETYPDLAPLLATPCDLVAYQKELQPVR